MARSVTFWNVFAKMYSKQKIADPQAYKYKLEETRKYFTKDSRVLEFGCGTGSTAIIHAENVKSILAIDYSKKMIEIAKGKLINSEIKNIDFRCAELKDINQPEASFDVVLGLNVLHLVEDVDGCVSKVYKLLKPGGHFISSTACVVSPFMRFVLPVLGATGLVPKINYFSSRELENTLKKVGFKILSSSAPGKDNLVQFIIAQKN